MTDVQVFAFVVMPIAVVVLAGLGALIMRWVTRNRSVDLIGPPAGSRGEPGC
jgi:hypothetical protein